MNRLRNSFLYFLGIFAMIATCFVSSILIADKYREVTLQGTIPVEEQLKVSKDKILSATTFLDEEKGVEIVSYNYISTAEVPALTKTEGKKVITEDLTKRTDHSVTFDLGNNTYESRVYGGQPFYKDRDKWYQTEYATTTKTSFDKQLKPTLGEIVKGWAFGEALADTTVTSGVSADGYARRTSANSVWTTLKAGAGTSFDVAGAITYAINTWSGTSAGKWSMINRGLFYFNTSILPDDATITTSTLYLFGQAKSDTFATDMTSTVNIYGTYINTTTIAANHFEAASSTAFSTSITYAAFNVANWNAWILNATGIAYIKLTDITYFTTREATFDAGAYTPVYESNKTNQIIVYTVEQTGLTNDPYLEVIYSIPTSISGPIIDPKNKFLIVD